MKVVQCIIITLKVDVPILNPDPDIFFKLVEILISYERAEFSDQHIEILASNSV